MRVEFTRLCQEHRISILQSGHHHCHEGWIQVHCPFCGDGSHGWHLGYSIEGGNMNCWRCGSHSILEWFCSVSRVSFDSAKKVLINYRDGSRVASKTKKVQVRRKSVQKPPGMGELLPAHRKYLQERGLHERKVGLLWSLRGTGHLGGVWAWRIVAPICWADGRVVGYTGRAINSDMRPRWRTTEAEHLGMDPRKLMYGLDQVPGDGVLIVEGPSDVWRMGPSAVGLLGIDWKVEQADILRRFKRRFILFDNQPVAQKRARELATWLAPFPGVTEIITGIESDPGDLSQKEADEIMEALELR